MVERYLSYASSKWKNFASSGWAEVRASRLSAEDFILFWGARVDRNSSIVDLREKVEEERWRVSGNCERKANERFKSIWGMFRKGE